MNTRLSITTHKLGPPNHCAWILNLLYVHSFLFPFFSVVFSLLFLLCRCIFIVHSSMMTAPKVLQLLPFCVSPFSWSLFLSLSLSPVCKSHRVRCFFLFFVTATAVVLRSEWTSGKVGRETRVRRDSSECTSSLLLICDFSWCSFYSLLNVESTFVLAASRAVIHDEAIVLNSFIIYMKQ